MSQDDDYLRAGTVQAGCKYRGIGTDETGDVRGVKLDDGRQTLAPISSGIKRLRTHYLLSVDSTGTVSYQRRLRCPRDAPFRLAFQEPASEDNDWGLWAERRPRPRTSRHELLVQTRPAALHLEQICLNVATCEINGEFISYVALIWGDI